jgi:CRISPR-associated protein Cas1
VCGHAGGFVTFDALRWLRDTGVAFSQLDWDGAVIIASGPRGPDRPALRRVQALVCSGVIPSTALFITREILQAKLKGQAEVARLMGWADASEAIESLATALAREADVSRVLAAEARAGLIYWKRWKDLPVRFARRNPPRFGPNGRSLPGRTDLWLTFGPRHSLLSGKPFRATTPGNALINYLYALLECEMIVALLAVGLDPGIGMFHTDVECRSSLALDAIEAARPHVDYWLLRYLDTSAFANRDFTELPDGEVRLTHPLNSHLAYTAALWRKACQPVAQWLAQSFGRAASVVMTVSDRMISVPQPIPAKLLERGRKLDPLTLPAPSSIRPDRSYLPRLPQARRRRRNGLVPPMCWECGKALALTGRGSRFCSPQCATAFTFPKATHKKINAGQPEKLSGRRAARRTVQADRVDGQTPD